MLEVRQNLVEEGLLSADLLEASYVTSLEKKGGTASTEGGQQEGQREEQLAQRRTEERRARAMIAERIDWAEVRARLIGGCTLFDLGLHRIKGLIIRANSFVCWQSTGGQVLEKFEKLWLTRSDRRRRTAPELRRQWEQKLGLVEGWTKAEAAELTTLAVHKYNVSGRTAWHGLHLVVVQHLAFATRPNLEKG